MEKLNPIDLIKNYWPDASQEHIQYCPELTEEMADGIIREGTGHDGTYFFTVEMFQKLLLPIVNRKYVFNSNLPKKGVKDIIFKIGKITHTSCQKEMTLQSGCGPLMGWVEEATIPVKVKYLY